jgi:hypothetical protein
MHDRREKRVECLLKASGEGMDIPIKLFFGLHIRIIDRLFPWFRESRLKVAEGAVQGASDFIRTLARGWNT